MNLRNFCNFLTAAFLFVWCESNSSATDQSGRDNEQTTSIAIDFSKSNGTIRPLHGVNFGPLCYRGMVDLSDYHRKLTIPLTRLHDVVWVNYDAVDISSIFRDFRNDPARADNYDFAATDDYLAAIVRTGSPILYRLGESIEHTPRKYKVHPPKDPTKWTDICIGIIRHYNEGWADGFHHQIRYWEIWNEPENQPAMWTGTDDQYFALYETASKAIKARWPALKVGGPSLGYTGDFEGNRFKPGDFLIRFLSRCRERQLPLDFFSWHRYAKHPADIAKRSHAIRQVLDEHGFTQTESHLNEWNYLPDENWQPMMLAGQGQERERWYAEMGGPRSAAFAAWALISLQDSPITIANYYTAEIQAFGMFTYNGAPRKNYYAFQAFNGLLSTPVRVATPPCEHGKIAICAGLSHGKHQVSVLMCNFDSVGSVPKLTISGLPWTGESRFECWLVDATHDFQIARQGTLPADKPMEFSELNQPAVLLLKIFPKAQSDQ